MDPRLLEQYIREIHTQCRFYDVAVTCLNNAQVFNQTGNLVEFYSIHGMLTHAGMISKLIWVPNRTTRPQNDGLAIREALGIDDKEWRLKSRTLRNDLEHYDERIRKWHPEGGNIVDMSIGPAGAISAGPGVVLFFNRHFDPQNATFEIRGTKVDLQSLTNEVLEIRQLAETHLPEYRLVNGF